MPTCKCPGEDLVGSVGGINGDGRGQTEQIAIHNAYRQSGLTEIYRVLAGLAFEWECAGNCAITTRFSIQPAAQTRIDPATGLWIAELNNVKLKVWVVCSRRAQG